MKKRTHSAPSRSLNIGAVLANREVMRDLEECGVTPAVLEAVAEVSTKTNPAHLKRAQKRNRLRLAANLRQLADELRTWALGAVRYAYLSDLIQIVEAAGSQGHVIPRSELRALAGYSRRFERMPQGLEELAGALDGTNADRNALAAAGWLERAERANVLAPRGRPMEPATKMAHTLSLILRKKSGKPRFNLVADVYNLATGRAGDSALIGQDLASLVKYAERLA